MITQNLSSDKLICSKRLRQKCLASRNKKEFPKIASQIFGKFRLISEDAAFVSPFIRFRDTKRA